MKKDGHSTRTHNRGILGNLLIGATIAGTALLAGGCDLKKQREQSRKMDQTVETVAEMGRTQEEQAVATRTELNEQNERLGAIKTQVGELQTGQDNLVTDFENFADTTTKKLSENSSQIAEGFESVRETMRAELGEVNESIEGVGDRVDDLDTRTADLERGRAAGITGKYQVENVPFYLTRTVDGDSETLSIFNSDDRLMEMIERTVEGGNVFVDSTESPGSNREKRRLGIYTGQEAKTHTESYNNLIERILSLSSSAERAGVPKPSHVLIPKFYFEMMAESWEEGNSNGRDLAEAEAEVRKALKGADDDEREAAVMKIRGIMASSAAPKPKDRKEEKYTVENAKFYLVKAVEGDSETLSIFDSNDNLVETLVRYVRGDEVFVDSIGSAAPGSAGRSLRVYAGDEATVHKEEYKNLIERIIAASEGNVEADFSTALEELRQIDDNPQYTLDDAAAKQLFSVFLASGNGAHLSGSSTSVPGDHFGRGDISLSRNAAKTQYNLDSGEESLRVLDVVIQGVPDDYVMISVTDPTKGVMDKKERAEKFKKALDELMEIDNKAQYTLEDERAMRLLEAFLASGQGAYVSAGRTSVPGNHFGMDSITIEDSLARQKEKENKEKKAQPADPAKASATPQKKDTTYTVRSGINFVRRIKAVTEGVPAGYVNLEVTDSTTDDGSPIETYNLDIPIPYFEAMVAALEAGNANGRDEAIAEKARQTKEAAARTNRKNRKSRRVELSRDYQRGLEARAMRVDEKNTSWFGDLSVGGESKNVRIRGGQDKRNYTLDGDNTDSSREFGELGFSFRLRPAPTGSTANGGPQLDISFYGEQAETSTDIAAGSPLVSVDGAGRYRITQQDLGGSSDADSDHVSLGIDVAWPTEKAFLKFGLWRGNESLGWHNEYDILIEDLTGIDPDIHNTPVIDGDASQEMTGVELLGAFPIDGSNKHQLSLYLALAEGSLNIDDGSNPETETDISEFNAGLGYRFLGDSWRMTAGGIYVNGEVGNDTHNAGQLLVAPVFKPNNYLVIAPSLNVTFPASSDDVTLPDGSTIEQDDSALWGAGVILAAGGSGSIDKTMEAVENFNAENMFESWSHRYTPQTQDLFRRIRYFDMARLSDSEFFLSLNGREGYNDDGEKTLTGDADLAVAHQYRSGAKFIWDIHYGNDEFGENYGTGLGYLGAGNSSIRLGYRRLKLGDEPVDALELGLKIGF